MAVDPSMATLTTEQKDHFMKYGYVRLPDCFSREQATEWTKDVWVRLGYSPTDISTWKKERINMPTHKTTPVQNFAPKAWAAICELLGGEDRIITESAAWNDGLIVNLGLTGEDDGLRPDPRDLTHWHVDGAHFTHYLDSPELGLLVLPLFSDVEERGGGTIICPDAIPAIAKHLHKHPEGVTGGMVPRGQQPPEDGQAFYRGIVKNCHEFHEMTGKAGDVILLHPFMCHSQSINSLRLPRIIINTLAALKEPFNYDRQDPNEYSLVERKTMQALGVERLPNWIITADRELVGNEYSREGDEMRRLELERLSQASRIAVAV